MPNTAIDDDDNLTSLLETRKAICEFLSGFLEQNHLLLKLIHFQVFIIQLFYKKTHHGRILSHFKNCTLLLSILSLIFLGL